MSDPIFRGPVRPKRSLLASMLMDYMSRQRAPVQRRSMWDVAKETSSDIGNYVRDAFQQLGRGESQLMAARSLTPSGTRSTGQVDQRAEAQRRAEAARAEVTLLQDLRGARAMRDQLPVTAPERDDAQLKAFNTARELQELGFQQAENQMDLERYGSRNDPKFLGGQAPKELRNIAAQTFENLATGYGLLPGIKPIAEKREAVGRIREQARTFRERDAEWARDYGQQTAIGGAAERTGVTDFRKSADPLTGKQDDTPSVPGILLQEGLQMAGAGLVARGLGARAAASSETVAGLGKALASLGQSTGRNKVIGTAAKLALEGTGAYAASAIGRERAMGSTRDEAVGTAIGEVLSPAGLGMNAGMGALVKGAFGFGTMMKEGTRLAEAAEIGPLGPPTRTARQALQELDALGPLVEDEHGVLGLAEELGETKVGTKPPAKPITLPEVMSLSPERAAFAMDEPTFRAMDTAARERLAELEKIRLELPPEAPPQERATIEAHLVSARAAVEHLNDTGRHFPDSPKPSGPGLDPDVPTPVQNFGDAALSIGGALGAYEMYQKLTGEDQEDVGYGPMLAMALAGRPGKGKGRGRLPRTAATAAVEEVAREAKRLSGLPYEVSTAGDSRFSALRARLSDGRTIEEAYQLDVKGYRELGDDWRLGKGKPPRTKMSKNELRTAYQDLWRQWTKENPELFQELSTRVREGARLTDRFARPGSNNQADALMGLIREAGGVPEEVALSRKERLSGLPGELPTKQGPILDAPITAGARKQGDLREKMTTDQLKGIHEAETSTTAGEGLQQYGPVEGVLVDNAGKPVRGERNREVRGQVFQTGSKMGDPLDARHRKLWVKVDGKYYRGKVDPVSNAVVASGKPVTFGPEFERYLLPVRADVEGPGKSRLLKTRISDPESKFGTLPKTRRGLSTTPQTLFSGADASVTNEGLELARREYGQLYGAEVGSRELARGVKLMKALEAKTVKLETLRSADQRLAVVMQEVQKRHMAYVTATGDVMPLEQYVETLARSFEGRGEPLRAVPGPGGAGPRMDREPVRRRIPSLTEQVERVTLPDEAPQPTRVTEAESSMLDIGVQENLGAQVDVAQMEQIDAVRKRYSDKPLREMSESELRALDDRLEVESTSPNQSVQSAMELDELRAQVREELEALGKTVSDEPPVVRPRPVLESGSATHERMAGLVDRLGPEGKANLQANVDQVAASWAEQAEGGLNFKTMDQFNRVQAQIIKALAGVTGQSPEAVAPIVERLLNERIRAIMTNPEALARIRTGLKVGAVLAGYEGLVGVSNLMAQDDQWLEETRNAADGLMPGTNMALWTTLAAVSVPLLGNITARATAARSVRELGKAVSEPLYGLIKDVPASRELLSNKEARRTLLSIGALAAMEQSYGDEDSGLLVGMAPFFLTWYAGRNLRGQAAAGFQKDVARVMSDPKLLVGRGAGLRSTVKRGFQFLSAEFVAPPKVPELLLKQRRGMAAFGAMSETAYSQIEQMRSQLPDRPSQEAFDRAMFWAVTGKPQTTVTSIADMELDATFKANAIRLAHEIAAISSANTLYQIRNGILPFGMLDEAGRLRPENAGYLENSYAYYVGKEVAPRSEANGKRSVAGRTEASRTRTLDDRWREMIARGEPTDRVIEMMKQVNDERIRMGLIDAASYAVPRTFEYQATRILSTKLMRDLAQVDGVLHPRYKQMFDDMYKLQEERKALIDRPELKEQVEYVRERRWRAERELQAMYEAALTHSDDPTSPQAWRARAQVQLHRDAHNVATDEMNQMLIKLKESQHGKEFEELTGRMLEAQKRMEDFRDVLDNGGSKAYTEKLQRRLQALEKEVWTAGEEGLPLESLQKERNLIHEKLISIRDMQLDAPVGWRALGYFKESRLAGEFQAKEMVGGELKSIEGPEGTRPSRNPLNIDQFKEMVLDPQLVENPANMPLQALSGAVISEPVAAMLDGITSLVPTELGRVMRGWRLGKTAFNPSTRAANQLSNWLLINSILTGEATKRGSPMVHNWWQTTDWIRPVQVANRRAGVGSVTDQMIREAHAMGITGRTRFSSVPKAPLAEFESAFTPGIRGHRDIEGLRRINASLDYMSPEAATVLRGTQGVDQKASRIGTLGKISDNVTESYGADDDVARAYLFHKLKEIGMPPTEAADMAREVLGDWTTQSQGLMTLRDTFMPFALYTAKAIPGFLHVMENPAVAMTYLASIGLMQAAYKAVLPEGRTPGAGDLAEWAGRNPLGLDVAGVSGLVKRDRSKLGVGTLMTSAVPMGQLASYMSGDTDPIPFGDIDVSGSPLIKMATVLGGRDQFGRPINRSSAGGLEKAYRIMKEEARIFTPPWLDPLYDLDKGDPRTAAQTALARTVNAPFRIRETTPGSGNMELWRMLRDDKSWIRRVFGMPTSDEIDMLQGEMNQKMKGLKARPKGYQPTRSPFSEEMNRRDAGERFRNRWADSVLKANK